VRAPKQPKVLDTFYDGIRLRSSPVFQSRPSSYVVALRHGSQEKQVARVPRARSRASSQLLPCENVVLSRDMTTNSIDKLSDGDLLDRTTRAAGAERYETTELLALLGELDARRLYLGEGCSSLFTYCTQVLHLSEHAAYHRIEVARAARRFPIILDVVADGSVTMTTVAILRPHLTAENHTALLEAARHKSKRQVEQQVAAFAPRPDAKPLIRRIPTEPEALAPLVVAPSTGDGATSSKVLDTAAASAAAQRPIVSPLASDRYLLRVTLSGSGHARLRRAQELMAHRVPNGDPAVVVEEALRLLVAQLERTKIASVRRPRDQSSGPSPSSSGSRHIPASIRRRVWRRDEGRCAFIGARGRCTETSRLEFHHVVPFARGGPTSVENIALLCRAHNGYESELAFGA